MLPNNQNTEPLCLRASGLGLNVIDVLDQSLTSAKQLIISNNSIKTLQNIEQFKELEFLDISNNIISFIEDLRPLSLLKNLKQLNIEGNPVCSFPIFKIYLIYLCENIQEINGKSVNSIIYKKKFNKNELKTIIAIEESLLNSALLCEFSARFLAKKPSLVNGSTIEFIMQSVLTPDLRRQKYSSIRKQFSGNGINRYFNNLKKLVMHRHQSICESLSKRIGFPKNVVQDYLKAINNIPNVNELVELSHGIQELNQILNQCLKFHQTQDESSIVEFATKRNIITDESTIIEEPTFLENQSANESIESQNANNQNQQIQIASKEFQDMKNEIRRLSNVQDEQKHIITKMKENYNNEIKQIKQQYEQILQENRDSIHCLKYEVKKLIENQKAASNGEVTVIPTTQSSEPLQMRIIHILQKCENDSNEDNWKETTIDDSQFMNLEKAIVNHQCIEIKKLENCDQKYEFLHEEITKLKNQVVLLSSQIAPYIASKQTLNTPETNVISESDYIEMKHGINELREQIEKVNSNSKNVDYIVQKRLIDDIKSSFEREMKTNNDKINIRFDEMSTKMKYDIEGIRKSIQETSRLNQIIRSTEEQNQQLRSEIKNAENEITNFREYLEKYSNIEKIEDLKEIYKTRYNEILLNIEEVKTTSNSAIESLRDQINDQASTNQSINPEQLTQIILTEFNLQFAKYKTAIDCLKHEIKKLKLNQNEMICQEIEKNLKSQKEYIEYMKDAYQNELDKINNKIVEINKEHEESMKNVTNKIKKLKTSKSIKPKE